MLGEAQIQQAEAQRAMGKKIAEVGAQTGEEIWSGVKKTGNSFAEIGIDFWNGLEVRNNNKFDSLYDFGNWLTVGSFDEVGSRIEGYKTRADMRNESPYDYVNWLSSGIAGSFKEAFNPDDPLSKEHWMGSFDVFTLILGAKGAAPKGSGPTLPKVNAKTPVPKIEERANLDVNKRKNDTRATGNASEGNPYRGGGGKIDDTPSTIKYLEDMIKNEGFEHGVIFDSKGNVLSKLITDSHPTKINFSPYKDQIKDAIVTHNHPTNGMFSWQDFETAIAFDAAEIRASLPNNVTFSMKRGSNGWSVSYNDIRDIFAETQNSFRNNPEIMKVYREEGYAKVNDMLMEDIANKIGGIYSVYK
ncbi:hypothetical protein [Paenibacillus sp. NAIST15-1]|uniref:hypothetical protein n=1 Tax=Paenibacillus sp. NAIST15-1 TaxID=1605994 RepID=UPI00086ED591|nr:hypothetical protein [Paenibacillus sp. NAIST15-1]GAV13707.1 hypothetical protein PBN151_3644 [Paenibacillus sp. NAIST15-1]